jgi:hypothetical protein
MQAPPVYPIGADNEVAQAIDRAKRKHGVISITTNSEGVIVVGPHQTSAEKARREANTKAANREKNRQARKARRKSRG